LEKKFVLFVSVQCKEREKILFFFCIFFQKPITRQQKTGQMWINFFLSIFDFRQKLRPKEEPVPSSRDKLNTRTNNFFSETFLNFFGDVGGGGGIQGEGHG